MFINAKRLAMMLVLMLVFMQSLTADTAKQVAYQFTAPLSAGENSLRRVTLPAEVLMQLQRADASDLVVLNADQQPVPLLIKPTQSVKLEQQQRSLTQFQAEDVAHVATLLRLAPDNAQAQRVHVELERLLQTERYYLLLHDPLFKQKTAAATAALPLVSLHLHWRDLPQWLPQSLRIETSHDLVNWQTAPFTAIPYVLNTQGTRLESPFIEFVKPILAPFVRLSGTADFAPLLTHLTGVEATFSSAVDTTSLNWLALDLVPSSKANIYSVVLPPALPIRQWRFQPEQTGYLYAGQWSDIFFRQYYLQTEAGALRSSAIPVAEWQREAGQWQFEFANASALPSANAESSVFEVGWQPLELYFLAQGSAPFSVQFANVQLSHAMGRDNFASNAPLLSVELIQQLQSESVSLGAITRIAPPVVNAPRSYGFWSLWVLLSVAVGILLMMAWYLWSEMQQDKREQPRAKSAQ